MQTIQNKSFTFEVFVLYEINLYLKCIVLGRIKNITLCTEIHIISYYNRRCDNNITPLYYNIIIKSLFL